MHNSTVEFKPLCVQAVVVAGRAPGILEKFALPDVDIVCLRYSGMLGQRVIAEPVLLTRKGKHVACEVPAQAAQEFTSLCLALLETRFPDWSAGEGAAGRFNWDLASDELTHTHALRILPDEATEGTAPLADEPGALSSSDIPF